jgi:hypothetical protein
MGVSISTGRAIDPVGGSTGVGKGGVVVAATATVAAFDTVPLDAVTVAVPSDTAATRPVAETVAIFTLLDDHFTAGLGMALPDWSSTIADSCTDSPTARVGAVALSEIALAWMVWVLSGPTTKLGVELSHARMAAARRKTLLERKARM